VTVWFAPFQLVQPLWVVVFAVMGAAMMGALGLVAGLWAEKFDQIAAFQNFIIMPMTFLSGVFYSVDSLPPFWKVVSHLNPFFYMIDGFRRGLFGVSDVSPWTGLAVVAASLALVCALCLHLLKIGYKIRH
jgi:ABC-2 type transport system permease protein